MKRRWTLVGTLGLLLIAVIGTARAQDMLRLSLREAIARGVETSHRLGELEALRLARAVSVDSIRAGKMPQVTLIGGYQRTNHVDEFGIPQPNGVVRIIYPDIPDNWRSRLDMQWSAYTGGRVEALTRAAQAEAEAARNDLQTAATDLRFEIARAYWSLVTARQNVVVVEQSVRRVEAHLADARARFEAGFLSPNDVTAAQAQRSLQEGLLIETRNAASVASLALARLVGAPPSSTIEPTDVLDSASELPADPALLVDEARQRRSDRKAVEERIRAGGERWFAAAAGSRPVLAIGAGVDYARPNPRIFPRAGEWQHSWDVGITASWSIFDGGRTKAEAAAAEALTDALRQRLGDLDAALEFDVRQRWLDIDSSRARSRAAMDAVKSAEETTRVLRDRFEVGVATSTDVLDAQSVLLDAALQRTRALAASRIAEAGLDRVLGR
ncbi:MAG: TolC family protein [Vicinamibacterales bacterium]